MRSDEIDQAASLQYAFAALRNRVAITRDARYAAHKRLNRRNAHANSTISYLSLFVIVISVLPNVHKFSSEGLQWLLLITIVNSVFIICQTLIDSRFDCALNVYFMQDSARDLDGIFNKIILASAEEIADPKWLNKKHVEYMAVLHDCPVDHEDIDYLAVQVSHPRLFEFKWKSYSPSKLALTKTFSFWKLHFNRYKWRIPHTIIVLLSILLICDLWFPDENFFGFDLLDDHVSQP